MGFLNNDTIVVDAILTKHGRKQLSDGDSLNITHFALSDDGIDYNLWNTGHPSGSAEYGTKLTKMPLIEAVPSDEAMMRYKLVTLDRQTEFMPVVSLQNDITTFVLNDINSEVSILPEHTNFAGETGFNFRITDTSPIVFSDLGGGSIVDMSGTPIDFPTQQDIPNFIEIINSTGITLQAQGNITANKDINITIEGYHSGALTSVTVRVLANA
mgnify:CR=1 FL=1